MTDEEFREKLISAINYVVGGQLSGPSGLEGLAMAMGGSDFVTRQSSVAASLDRVADAIESLAEAVREHKP